MTANCPTAKNPEPELMVEYCTPPREAVQYCICRPREVVPASPGVHHYTTYDVRLTLDMFFARITLDMFIVMT